MKRAKNEGSIRERKDGRFEVHVTAGYDFKTSKSKRISYYTKTKAEAVKSFTKRSITSTSTTISIPHPQS